MSLSAFNLPEEPIFKLIWPDDSYIAVGSSFGEYRDLVSTIIPVERPGGLGPALWYEVYAQDTRCIGEVNAAYVAALTYGKRVIS